MKGEKERRGEGREGREGEKIKRQLNEYFLEYTSVYHASLPVYVREKRMDRVASSAR